MRRLLLMVSAFAVACSPGDREDDAGAATSVPIGPGSDSTALFPPDTPVSNRQPDSPPRGAPDSVPITTR